MLGNIKTILGIIAGVIAFSAYIIYIISIFRGGSKPNRATWWIWAFMGLVLAVSYYFSGAHNTIWVPFVEFLGPLSIAILSIKYGEGGLESKTDLYCIFGALLSIILWIIFDNAVIALVTNLFTDTFAIIPTIKKSYNRPEGEDFSAWFGTGVADTLNLFAVEKSTFGILIYPIYMLTSDLIIIGILLFKKSKKDLFNFLKKEDIIYKGESKLHGTGIFASRDIKKGETVLIVNGDDINFMIDSEEQAEKAGMNWFGIGKNQWLGVSHSFCDFLNHSCDPNVGIKEKNKLVAIKDIKKDAEITLDYSFNESDIFWQIDCNCGSYNCRKNIKSIQFLPPEVFEKYKEYIPNYYQNVFKDFHISKFNDFEDFKKNWINFLKSNI